MAGPRSNTIEYVFEGDTLNLEQAISRISKLLNASARKMRKYQNGVLTAEQDAELRSARKLLTRLRKVQKQKGELTAEEARQTRAAGREALKRSRQMEAQAARVERDALRREQETLAQKAKLLSVAGQEQARQQAAYLNAYANRFRGQLSEQAYV